jgi:hypothetical protein
MSIVLFLVFSVLRLFYVCAHGGRRRKSKKLRRTPAVLPFFLGQGTKACFAKVDEPHHERAGGYTTEALGSQLLTLQDIPHVWGSAPRDHGVERLIC